VYYKLSKNCQFAWIETGGFRRNYPNNFNQDGYFTGNIQGEYQPNTEPSSVIMSSDQREEDDYPLDRPTSKIASFSGRKFRNNG
jgi:hypothetical protein